MDTMTTEERDMELMQKLDDAWNSQDLDTFAKRHKDDVVVRWPGKPLTNGIHDHTEESRDFFRAFPDQKLDNRPYRVLFASGGTVARWDDGRIMEENLFYDLVTFMQQIGVGS